MDLSYVILKIVKILQKITYEPWHLRYVGEESAAYISKHDITLEEYLEQLQKK